MITPCMVRPYLLKTDKFLGGNQMKNSNKLEIIYFSEIDTNAAKAFSEIHNVPLERNLGDISKVKVSELTHPVDVLFGGPPCVNFSTAGNLSGSCWVCSCGHSFDPLTLDSVEDVVCPKCGSTELDKTASSLMVYWFSIFQSTRPKFAIFENVANLLSKRFIGSFNLFAEKVKSCGYDVYYQKMNSKDYGIPQNRERVIFVAIRHDINNGKFRFPDKIQDGKTINDLLDENSYLFSNTESNVLVDDAITPYIRANIMRELDDIIQSDKNIYRPKCTSGWNDHQIGIKYAPALRASNPNTIVLQTIDTPAGKKYYIKRLTPREAYRFMGFSDKDYEKAASVCPKTALYRQAGNSIVVDVAYLVLKELYKAMPYLFEEVKTISLFSGIGALELALKKVIDEANSPALKGGDLLE